MLTAGTAGGGAQSGGGSGWSMLIFFVAIILIFWLFMIRPQQKKQKKIEEARNSLSKGDKIITIGGIHGKIVDVRESTFIIAVEDNSHIEIEKAAVAIDENKLNERK
ncbi:MAG: preprotein translocase subunit YajC [Bacteroidales bacterium]|nr:preprotein translocase subunit YajC [Bacteroidales bacterium]